MNEIKILSEKVKAESLKEFAENWYIDFLKGCVDLMEFWKEKNQYPINFFFKIELVSILIF